MQLNNTGQLDHAVASYRQALVIDPDRATTHSNFLFTHNYYFDQCAARLFAEA